MEWDSFYVIVGSAAGALIGLQFVVMTLIADRPKTVTMEAGQAFATPTVVHFSACLLISALIQIPWSPLYAAWSAGALGLGGLVYMTLPVQRMRRQNSYQMDWEDCIFHVALPFLGYGTLLVLGFFAHANTVVALFGVAAAVLLLLFVGITTPGMRWPIRSLWCAATTRKSHKLVGGDGLEPPTLSV
jgi:hypothetical protein